MDTQVPAKVSGVSAIPGVNSGQPIIQITWNPPQSDKRIEKYYLQHRKANASNWTAVTLGPSETTVLSGLDRGTVYHVQLRAISIVGSGPFSDLQQVTTHNGKGCEDAYLCMQIPCCSMHIIIIVT